MSIGHELHASNVDAMRREFLREIAAAAPRNDRTTYAEWDGAIRAHLNTLRSWLTDADLQLPPRPEFCVLPESSLPSNAYGYSYFRAWLRKRNLDPDDFRPDQPTIHMGEQGD